MDNMKKIKHTGIMNKMRDKMPLIIIILIIAFLATIVFEWGMNYLGMGGKVDAFGKVNSHEITYQEFEKIVQQQIEQMRQQNNGKDVTEDQIKQVREQVWNSLVSQALTKEAIEKYGIKVSDQEILDWIYNRPETLPEPIKRNFMDSTGVFNVGFYQQALNMKTKEATQFWSQVENYLRETMLSEKLQGILSEGVVVSEADVLEKYKDDNIFANVDFALFELNTITDSSQFAVNETELRNYYDKNKNDFKQNESVKLHYVQFQNTASAEDSANLLKQMVSFQRQLRTLEVADSSLIKFVTENSSGGWNDGFQKPNAFDAKALKFLFSAKPGDISDPIIGDNTYQVVKLLDSKEGTEQFVNAVHILIKADADSVAAKKKATDLYNRVKNGEDIEALAFEFSEDPSAKTNKGNLGWFNKGAMVKEFEEAAFNNPEGAVIGPVKSNFGYHVIKVLGKSKSEFKIAQVIKAVTPSSRSMQITKNKAEEFYQEVTKKGQNFDSLAKQLNLTVQQSPEIQADGSVPIAGKDKGLIKSMLDSKVNTVTEPVKVSNGYAVYKITEKFAEGYQNFDSIKTTLIKPRVINEKKFQILSGIANDMYGKISNGDLMALKAIAPQYTYEKADSLSVGKPNSITGNDFALISTIYKMKPGEISKPFKGIKGYYIVKLNSITEFSETDYLVKAPEIRKNMLTAKRQQIVSEWLMKMQNDADIVDNRNKYLN